MVGAVVFLAAALRLDADAAELARLVILGSALGAVAAIDLAQHRVPNRIVIPRRSPALGCSQPKAFTRSGYSPALPSSRSCLA